MTKKMVILCLITLQGLLLALPTDASVVIDGIWTRGNKEVSLYKIVAGRLETLCTYYLDGDNRSFGFHFSPQTEGYYVIGSGAPQSHQDKYVFYFKSNDRLSIEVNDTAYTLVGNNNSPENIVMAEWHKWMQPLEWMAVYFSRGLYTYVDFFPALEHALENPFTVKETPNKQFNESFARFRENDFVSTAIYFLNTPRTAHPQQEDYPDFYRQIDLPKLTADASLMEYPYGARVVSSVLMVQIRLNNQSKMPSLQETLAVINNDVIKGEYLIESAARIKTYTGYKELMTPYEQYIITNDQKKRAGDIAVKLAKEETAVSGSAAVDFTCRDINGKNVSLSNFKGKVVVVDVWATWCGPCQVELPHLKQFTTEYEGKEVVVMSVSVDVEKDLQKWKDFIKKEEMKGVQLFAGGFESDIARFYNITAIPRFLLFDKQGNIVLSDAPRPSSNELRLIVNDLLKK